MPKYSTESIRTVALVGHTGAGKTTLAEALLAKAGVIASAGSVEKGNTVCDFDPLEREYKHSLNSALVNFAWKNVHIHLIDTPGSPDFMGQAIGALAAVETAVIVVNAETGIQLATDRMLKWAAKRNLCRMIVINRIDAENADLPAILSRIQQAVGRECLPINLPAKGGKDVVDCFFNPDGEADFSSVKEAHAALVDQVVEVDDALMEKYLEQGEVSPGQLFTLQGKDYVETDALVPGDIGAVTKVEEIEFDRVLHDSHDEDHIHLRPLEFPVPMHGIAVETKKKGDEQRLFEVLHKLEMEDPCFKLERHATTNETVIRGLGELHMRAKLDKMLQQYKMELVTKPPKIPYRETITRLAAGNCRRTKQTGGAGQFGEVFLRVEPLPRGKGYEFVDKVKGGVIPNVFIPAVEKGVRMALDSGVIAGYPVHDIRVTVYDGKQHAVDSKEAAFVSAASKAITYAFSKAGAIVLEPIVNIEIAAPDKFMGDLTSDLSGKRGQVTGTDNAGGELTTIKGMAPLSELSDYQTRLKSVTGGQGSYSIDFSHYAPVPPHTQAQLVSKHKQPVEEEQ